MQPIDFEGELARIIAKDPRFDREAYIFVRRALDYCHKSILKSFRKSEAGIENHVTVAQLLDGIRLFALEEYGPMALTVLHSWGVESCEHFGDLVFNMVEYRLLSITEKDTREEFRKGYDFQDAFRTPFLPRKKAAVSMEVKEPSAT